MLGRHQHIQPLCLVVFLVMFCSRKIYLFQMIIRTILLLKTFSFYETKNQRIWIIRRVVLAFLVAFLVLCWNVLWILQINLFAFHALVCRAAQHLANMLPSWKCRQLLIETYIFVSHIWRGMYNHFLFSIFACLYDEPCIVSFICSAWLIYCRYKTISKTICILRDFVFMYIPECIVF